MMNKSFKALSLVILLISMLIFGLLLAQRWAQVSVETLRQDILWLLCCFAVGLLGGILSNDRKS